MARREPITRPQTPKPFAIPMIRPKSPPKSPVKMRTNVDDLSGISFIVYILLSTQLHVINSDDLVVGPVQD